MKKFQNKKGLFLAEILLAVVIVSVIVGAGFMVYNNIQTENDKNKAVQNLTMMLSMVNPIMDGEKATGNNVDVTDLYAKSKLLPNTVDIQKVGGNYEATSAYGYPLRLTMEDKDFANWALTYEKIDNEQCTKFVQAIMKTKPIMIGGLASTCGSTAGVKLTGLEMAQSVCKPHPAKTDLKLVFSPNNEDTTSAGAGKVCVAY